jgi:hypothetical protein
LFVLPGWEYCGASNCVVVGYRQAPHGWEQIYDGFGGDGILVLKTRTKDHYDIVQSLSQGMGSRLRQVSMWTGSRYAADGRDPDSQ